MKHSKTCFLNAAELDVLFGRLEEKYAIYAPVKVKSGGRYALQDSILYRPVHSFRDIEFHARSTFSLKEVLKPVTKTMFYFTEDEFRESSEKDDRDILVFGRACDINSVKIHDEILLHNGPYQDSFYKQRRQRTKFVLMECTEQFEGCFCCSVGANKTDMHSLAVSPHEDGAYFEVKDEQFSSYFKENAPVDYTISFPEKNELTVDFPIIEDIDTVNKLKAHPMWKEFDDRCIGCGSCTIACSTCTCFETTDIVYSQNAQVGERRRTSSSCMIEGYDTVAGGGMFRRTIGDRYRNKILHKIYGYNARFHSGPMCVGCGRCSARCPENISYPETLKKVSRALEDIKKEAARHD